MSYCIRDDKNLGANSFWKHIEKLRREVYKFSGGKYTNQ